MDALMAVHDRLACGARLEAIWTMQASNPQRQGAADAAADAAAEGLARLAHEIDGCRLCPLCLTRTQAVPGEGPAQAILMLVGEGPGFEEDRQGRPFVGRSGQFLIKKLNEVGIQRSDVFITNVVKCRPPENRDPESGELAACSAYLTRQIALVNPRIIVTLGRFSARRWFEQASITRIHGQIKNIGRGRVAVAMFHPAAALRNAQWQAEFERDLRKLPPLLERAKAANHAALRGEALPAGVPHPGDPDFLGEGADAPEEADLSSIGSEESTRSSDRGDDATQLSLF